MRISSLVVLVYYALTEVHFQQRDHHGCTKIIVPLF